MQNPIRIITLLVVLLLAAACAPAPTATPTPGLHTQPEPASPAAPASPVPAIPAWTAQLPGAVNAAPFVSGDLVIVASADGSLHAIQAETGSPAWDFSPANKIWDASANGDENRVCMGLAGGQVTCLDARTGQPLWTADLGLEAQSRLAITPDRVYAPTTLAGPGLTKDYSGHASLFCLDAATGAVIWEAVTDNYILRRPVVNGDVILTGGAYQVDGQAEGTVATRVYAINTADGSVRWKYESDDGLVRWVESAGEVVAFSAGTETVHALSLQDGHPLWDFGPGYWMQYPVMASGKIYFGSGDENLQALDAASGKKLWQHAINMSSLNQVGQPILRGDQLWFNAVTGEIYALDLSTGDQVAYLLTGKSSRVGGAIFGNFYILGDPDGKLYAFSIP